MEPRLPKLRHSSPLHGPDGYVTRPPVVLKFKGDGVVRLQVVEVLDGHLLHRHFLARLECFLGRGQVGPEDWMGTLEPIPNLACSC